MMGEEESNPLLVSNEEITSTTHEVQREPINVSEFVDEGKKQLGLAAPLIAANILQYCLQVISLMFVGHLGELPLSSASMATSFASVTGYSVLLGMASALETLCGQAYGAKQYHMLGIYTQRAILILLTLSIALSLIWFNTGSILATLGQDKEISFGAGEFNRWMIPGLFAYGVLQCLMRFLQTQNIVVPMMISSGLTALFHILMCWVLLFKFELGSKWAALANAISYWVNVLLLALYIQFSKSFSKSFTGFSAEAIHDLLGFLRLSIPSALMICLEYWSFEMVVLLSGLLPNPKLETSVLSISLNTCWMVYTISVGLGGAVRKNSFQLAHWLGSMRRLRQILGVPLALMCTEGGSEQWDIVKMLLSEEKLKFGFLFPHVISLNVTLFLHVMIMNLSTRVSNEFGAKQPQRARLAVCVAALIATSEGVIVGMITILVRDVWGKLYSNETEVITYVARIMPILALSNFIDGFQCVLSGAARGCGWQKLCAFINLGAYYVVGIPCAVLFAFIFHIGGIGLWMGIICGLAVQALILVIVNLSTDWENVRNS